MGATTRFGLRYPAGTDAPSGPQLGQFLAEDVDGWLCRAFPCTSSTRPTGVPDRFLIGETDTGKILYWHAGGSTWVEIGGGGGGGGGYTAVKGEWRASSNQSIPSGADTAVAFGNEVTASPVVTRTTFGGGHKFTLTEAGAFAVSVILRYAAGAAGNRFAALLNSANTAVFDAAGGDGGPGASTLKLAATDRFAAGTELYVSTAQSSGSALALQRATTSPPIDGYVAIRIVKVAG